MAIPYDIGNQAVIAIEPEYPTGVPPSDLTSGVRVLAPIYNPHCYVKHWPAAVVKVSKADVHGHRLVVRYEEGHGVGNYGPIRRGDVYAADLVLLD